MRSKLLILASLLFALALLASACGGSGSDGLNEVLGESATPEASAPDAGADTSAPDVAPDTQAPDVAPDDGGTDASVPVDGGTEPASEEEP